MERLALQKSSRSPEGGDTLGCERVQENPPQQETAHGEVYRAGCPRVKLHAGGHDAEREAERVACQGPKDDRRNAFGLAEGLRLGAIKRKVYRERGGFGALGYHAKGYRWIRNDGVRVKNRLKALYRSRGVAVAGRGVYTATKRGEEGNPHRGQAASAVPVREELSRPGSGAHGRCRTGPQPWGHLAIVFPDACPHDSPAIYTENLTDPVRTPHPGSRL